MALGEIKKLGVFCGSKAGNSAVYADAVEKFADVLMSLGITLVYGGAKVGLMGCIANRMLSGGANVIGVMPQSLIDVEIAHPGLTKLYVVNSMHERKALMASLVDGFVMLPGGSGSVEEFFEIFTWAQLGYHEKPCGILNVSGYYDHLLKFLDHAVAEGFLKSIYRDMVIVDQSPKALMNRFLQYKAPLEKKWVNEIIVSASDR